MGAQVGGFAVIGREESKIDHGYEADFDQAQERQIADHVIFEHGIAINPYGRFAL
jgi:hypothetical protein